MLTIVWWTIKDRKYLIIIFSTAGVVLLWLYILLFPSMQEIGKTYWTLWPAIPKTFTKIFPITAASFTSIENFLAIEQYSLMVSTLIIFMLVAIAGTLIAGDYVSFFHYLDSVGALIFDSIGAISIVVFSCCAIIFTIAGAWWFVKRDITI